MIRGKMMSGFMRLFAQPIYKYILSRHAKKVKENFSFFSKPEKVYTSTKKCYFFTNSQKNPRYFVKIGRKLQNSAEETGEYDGGKERE